MNQVQQFFEYLFQSLKIWVIVQPWESGLIVRNGNKIRKVEKGIYFKIPYFDSVYVQETRLRVVSLPVQTLTSKDQKTITMNGAIGYIISDIEKLYKTLYHPETTISNITMSEVSDFIFTKAIDDITPGSIEEKVLEKLNADDFGITFEYFRITNFAIVRTFRLIQDQSWNHEGLPMDSKK